MGRPFLISNRSIKSFEKNQFFKPSEGGMIGRKYSVKGGQDM
jgi:hypothetical protein